MFYICFFFCKTNSNPALQSRRVFVQHIVHSRHIYIIFNNCALQQLNKFNCAIYIYIYMCASAIAFWWVLFRDDPTTTLRDRYCLFINEKSKMCRIVKIVLSEILLINCNIRAHPHDHRTGMFRNSCCSAWTWHIKVNICYIHN